MGDIFLKAKKEMEEKEKEEKKMVEEAKMAVLAIVSFVGFVVSLCAMLVLGLFMKGIELSLFFLCLMFAFLVLFCVFLNRIAERKS